MTSRDEFKRTAAEAALRYLPADGVLGVGTGSTAQYFIKALASVKHKIEACVASSVATAAELKAHGLPVVDLNTISELPVYIDGTDEVNTHLQLIKGGGGALTREKILATVAKKFICIADHTKQVNLLGTFPLAIEVLPMARSYVARELIKLGGFPVYRQNFVTDNGNIILDTHHLPMTDPLNLEQTLNNIVGIVENGLFAYRPADVLLLGTPTGVNTISR